MQAKTKNQLRCVCSRKPLLAYYGIDKKDKLYVHIRVYKQSRVYGEFVITSGECQILCRECYRWTRVIFATRKIDATHDVPTPPLLAG